jgi:putative ABC transport system ATP-binding protein/lipoprotein-releasing system ATP-binding protein
VIAVTDLQFQYQSGGDEILGGLTHTFDDGEFSVVTGPSGRGKSTLLYLVGLLLSPGAGDIEVDGVATTGLSDRERSLLRSEKIGFVFQDSALDSTRSVLDNVVEGGLYAGLGRRQAEGRARDLLDAACRGPALARCAAAAAASGERLCLPPDLPARA